jgi:hypothetical protein
VKYVPAEKAVYDKYGLRAAIPKGVNLILNPIHDRMTRFEMPLKRRFISEGGRWVVSVWNKGKRDKRGCTRDGSGPAWSVFYHGAEQSIAPTCRDQGIEIGIVNISGA